MRPTVKKRERCPLDGCFTLSQAEELLGLRGGGLGRWIKRHGLKVKKVGKYRCITPEQLERYEKATNRGQLERASKRPTGYVGIHAATELVGCSHALIWKEAERGGIHGVRVGYIQYYNRADCLKFAQSYNERPLPGYSQVLDYAKPRRADVQSLLRWLRKHDGQPRKFRRPQDKQFAWYALTEALDAWAAQYRHANRGQKLTDDQVIDILTRLARGEKRRHLAIEYGISEALIRHIRIGKTYKHVQFSVPSQDVAA